MDKKERNKCVNCGKECSRATNKFCSNECCSSFRTKKLYIKWESEGFFPHSKNLSPIRRYLIEKHGHKCSICGLSEWLEKPISLAADHIDGNYDNNRIDNLRLVCPNCDSTLPTWKGRNKGSGRTYRMAQ